MSEFKKEVVDLDGLCCENCIFSRQDTIFGRESLICHGDTERFEDGVKPSFYCSKGQWIFQYGNMHPAVYLFDTIYDCLYLRSLGVKDEEM